MPGGALRQEFLAKLQKEFDLLRLEHPEVLALDSDFIREEQVRKTTPRLEIIQALRSDSLARSTQFQVG